jgi:hypothetical protein
MTTPTSVWERLDELTDGERKTLVDSAVTVLNGKLGPEEAVTSGMPDSVIRSRMVAALSDAGLAATPEEASAVMSSASDPDIVLEMLSGLASVPELAGEIEREYQSQEQMMFLDAGVITGPALVLLLIKLKRIKIDSLGVDLQFYDAHSWTAELIRRLFGS